jgi:transposase, IS5 family
MRKSFATQPALFVGPALFDHPALKALDPLEALFDWPALEALLTDPGVRATGRPGYPAQTLFRALLLGIWYSVSDEQLAEQLARDLLFRKFCRLEIDAATPDATTIGRFRARLEAQGRLAVLFDAVKAQLAAQNVIMAEGRVAIVDATVIEAARTGRGKLREGEPDTRDPEAGAHVKINARGRKVGTWGYQFQVNADEDGFIHDQVVTPGNAHEIRAWEGLMTGGETQLYADCAYSAQETRDTLAARGIADRVQRKGYRNRPLPQPEVERNIEIGVTRAGVERIFGHGKRVWGLVRTRFMGLRRNRTHFTLVAIAWNLWKGGRFFKLYGLRTP